MHNNNLSITQLMEMRNCLNKVSFHSFWNILLNDSKVPPTDFAQVSVWYGLFLAPTLTRQSLTTDNLGLTQQSSVRSTLTPSTCLHLVFLTGSAVSNCRASCVVGVLIFIKKKWGCRVRWTLSFIEFALRMSFGFNISEYNIYMFSLLNHPFSEISPSLFSGKSL